MAPVSTADSSDRAGVAGCRQPVVNRCPNAAALDRCLARAMMASDQQQYPVPGRDGLLQRAVDGRPRRVERHAMQVEGTIGPYGSGSKLPVPAPIERRGLQGLRRSRRWRRRSYASSGPCFRNRRAWRCRNLPSGWRLDRLARQRADRSGNSGPELRFVSAERAHGPHHPWAKARTPGRWPPCRRPGLPLRPLRPRRYRSGWSP